MENTTATALEQNKRNWKQYKRRAGKTPKRRKQQKGGRETKQVQTVNANRQQREVEKPQGRPGEAEGKPTQQKVEGRREDYPEEEVYQRQADKNRNHGKEGKTPLTEKTRPGGRTPTRRN